MEIQTLPVFMQRLLAFDPKALPIPPTFLQQNGALISVLIRTCNRPGSLRQTLESLRAQTAKNFEVLVVEDGPEESRAVCEEYADLPIHYEATGVKVGRCKAGNRLLQLAKGEICNFLDDDDYFYPWHIAVVNALACTHPEAGLYCTGAQEIRCVTMPGDGSDWTIQAVRPVVNEQVVFYQMAQANRLPIQTVAFRRYLTDELGGFSLDLDAYEDWDLWVRLLAHTEAVATMDITTLYKAQADLVAEARRILWMKSYRPVLVRRFYQYEKLGQNAGELAGAVKETEQEKKLDQLRMGAEELMADCEKVSRTLRYRLGKAKRARARAAGRYNLPEHPAQFDNLVDCAQFLYMYGNM